MADTKQNGTAKLAENGQNGYRVIGTRPVRPDGVDKVTGRAIYAADVQMTGLLHGFVPAQSPCPCLHSLNRHE